MAPRAEKTILRCHAYVRHAVLLCLQEEPADLAKADRLYSDLCKAAGCKKDDQSMEPLRTFFHLKVICLAAKHSITAALCPLVLLYCTLLHLTDLVQAVQPALYLPPGLR